MVAPTGDDPLDASVLRELLNETRAEFARHMEQWNVMREALVAARPTIAWFAAQRRPDAVATLAQIDAALSEEPGHASKG